MDEASCHPSDLSMFVVDMDEGCGVIRRKESQQVYPVPTLDYSALGYDFLERHRREALNLVSVDEGLKLLR